LYDADARFAPPSRLAIARIPWSPGRRDPRTDREASRQPHQSLRARASAV